MRKTALRMMCAAAATLMAAAGIAALPAQAGAATGADAQWPMFGQNLANTANSSGFGVGTSNVASLRPKWTFTTGGDVSARAAVVNGVAYVPDWSGHLYAINANSGRLIWSKDILSDYLPGVFANPPAEVVSRTSPFVDMSTHTLYIGTQTGAYLLAINLGDGALKWKTQLDAHPAAIDTQSPIVQNGVVYVGVASTEEGLASNPSYPCCSFRGSVVALDARTGAQKWKTYTIPTGYTGGAVWGSTIVPDPARGVVYATTGNNYSNPTDPAFTECVAKGGTAQGCLSPDDHFDSVLALRMRDGGLAWSQRLSSSDDWNVACNTAGSPNCPSPAGPDFDFGSGVNMFTIQNGHGSKTIIGAGQKSGVYSALDPDNNGKLLWATQVGPGSTLGGLEWGSASDGNRIYVAIGNVDQKPYTLQPSGEQATAGSWAALDPATGHVIWQVADPNGSFDLGPMSVAHGVVYAPSMAGTPTSNNMFALDAATGRTLWSFAAGGSVLAGAALANGTVYWGSGYSRLGSSHGFTPNNKFYAFSIGGR